MLMSALWEESFNILIWKIPHSRRVCSRGGQSAIKAHIANFVIAGLTLPFTFSFRSLQKWRRAHKRIYSFALLQCALQGKNITFAYLCLA